MNKIYPVVLPKDNGPHDFTVEWWYFNGHIYDRDGKEYSFMDCFFKVNIAKVKIPHIAPHLVEDIFKKGEYLHFAHSVITDIANNKSYKEIQNISVLSSDSFKKDLLYINYKNAHILGADLNGKIVEISPNNFHIKTKDLDLILESKKKPLLEGGHGYVGTPKAGSYYYSFTDLRVKGNINIKGREIEVRGKAWMDHQWANASYKGKSDKWTWFSFHLEGGIEIMCVEYDTETGTDILIDIINSDGTQKQYKKAIIKPLGKFWKSKKTKAKYPLSWIIEIKEANILLEAEALVKDQEMIFGQINYWEGPMKVKARMNGKKFRGRGFMELVGYESDYNYLILESEELEKSIWKKIKNFFNNL
ncbi:MAG: lipocalin-like domain-containing protein [Candidatus Paceibacterota bacterium]